MSHTELVAKQNGKGLILIIVAPIIALVTLSLNPAYAKKWISAKPFLAVFLISTLLALTIYCLYKILDAGIKLVVDKNGIWTIKAKLITWNNILSYKFEKRVGRIVSYYLIIDSQNPGRELKIDITYLDKDHLEVKQAIEFNSKGYSIEYLGFLETSY